MFGHHETGGAPCSARLKRTARKISLAEIEGEHTLKLEPCKKRGDACLDFCTAWARGSLTRYSS